MDDLNRIRRVFDPFGTSKPVKPKRAPKWIQDAIAPQRAKPNLTPRPQQGGLQATPWSLGGWLEDKTAKALGGVFGEREGARLGAKLFSAINDFTPVGDAVGMDAGGRQAYQGLTRGHLGQAAVGAGTFALSALPGVLEGPIRSAARNSGIGGMFTNLLRNEDGAIRAWHASPYDFDRFSYNPKTRGTGDGTQMQGDGLYFAEKRDVSENYLEAFKRRNGSGRLYEVEIDAEPGQLLDWDAPVDASSPQHIRDALNKIARDNPHLKERLWNTVGQPGWAFYSELTGAAKTGDLVKNQEYATSLLRDAGVPGIRYLDRGSRDGVGGTHNYVVFDDNLVSILNKY